MKAITLLLSLMLLTGCTYQLPVYTPEIMVRPEVVGHGAHFSLRLWGAEIVDYAFLGATQRPDGSWSVRLDPVLLGLFNQESLVTVREGDILPLGPGPAILVKFLSISPTELKLRAVGVRAPSERF